MHNPSTTHQSFISAENFALGQEGYKKEKGVRISTMGKMENRYSLTDDEKKFHHGQSKKSRMASAEKLALLKKTPLKSC